MRDMTTETYAFPCWKCGETVEVNLYRHEGLVCGQANLLCETRIKGYLVETRNRETLPHEGKVSHAETICWEWDGVGRGKRLLVSLAPANSLFQHDLIVSRIRRFGSPNEPQEDMALR